MFAIFSIVITFIIILSVASLGGMITEKSGVINLSIEGFMTIGAITYASVISSSFFQNNMSYQWIVIPFSGLSTSLFSILYIVVTVKLKANQMIAGIALNALALAISLFIVRFKGSSEIELQPSLWNVGIDNSSFLWIFNIAFFIGVPLIILVPIFFFYTKLGKKIKACGENPHAAASLGIKVEWIQTIAIMLSSFICGIAGAIYAQQISQFFLGSVQGIGFLAVALVIFGQWKPLFIISGAIIFGTIYALMNNSLLVPGLNQLGSVDLLKIIPYALSISVLIFTSKNSRSPKYLGIPFYNQGR